MSLEGELFVRLHWNGRGVDCVDIASTRRSTVAGVLRGRTPDEALAWVSRVFAICAMAQTRAAELALMHAGAKVAAAKVAAGTQRGAVEREVIDEYLFRLLIDWPRAVGEPVDANTVAEARRMPRESLARMASERVFGEVPSTWLARRTTAELDAWTARGATLPARLLGALLQEMPALGRSRAALMPDANAEDICTHVITAMARDATYAQAPTWDGLPMETGPLARMKAHPLVAAIIARDGNTAAARMVARLAELALLVEAPGVMSMDGFATAEGEGIGTVQTARGLLLHKTRVADGHVAEYCILAPTEWNFHPKGALHDGLLGVAAADVNAVEQRARVTVQALDPCVACAIEVARA